MLNILPLNTENTINNNKPEEIVLDLDLNNDNVRGNLASYMKTQYPNWSDSRIWHGVENMWTGQNMYGQQFNAQGQTIGVNPPNQQTNNMGYNQGSGQLGSYRNQVGNGQTYSWDSNNNAFYTQGNNVGVGTTGLAHSGANVQLDPNTRYNFGNNRIGRKLGAAYDATTGTINTANLGRRSMRRLRKVLNRQGNAPAPVQQQTPVQEQQVQAPAPAQAPVQNQTPVQQSFYVPPLQWNIPGVTLNDQNEFQWNAPDFQQPWRSAWRPYIPPSTSIDWTNGQVKFNIDTSPANWRAYSRHSGINPSVASTTPASTSATSEASSATTPTTVTSIPATTSTAAPETNPVQEAQTYFNFGDISVANEAKRRRAAAELGYGGVLKAAQGSQIKTKTSQTPTLDAIMNNPQLAEQFLTALSQKLGKEITIDQLSAAAADPEMGQQLEMMAQSMMSQAAKHGAKLNYIARLRNKCPEGQELVYYAKGGRICSACMGKKLEQGGEPTYMRQFKAKQAKKGCKLKK